MSTYIRAWRNHRGLSLESLAARVGLTHASLSRIERGLQPYGQRTLERLADELQTDAASLLARNPTATERELERLRHAQDMPLHDLKVAVEVFKRLLATYQAELIKRTAN